MNKEEKFLEELKDLLHRHNAAICANLDGDDLTGVEVEITLEVKLPPAPGRWPRYKEVARFGASIESSDLK